MEDEAPPARKRRRRRGKVPLPSFAPLCTDEDAAGAALARGGSRNVRSLPYHRHQQQTQVHANIQQQQQQQQQRRQRHVPLTLTRREFRRLQQEESPLQVETPPTQPSESPIKSAASSGSPLRNRHTCTGDLFTQQQLPPLHLPNVSRTEKNAAAVAVGRKASNTTVQQLRDTPVRSTATPSKVKRSTALPQSCQHASLELQLPIHPTVPLEQPHKKEDAAQASNKTANTTTNAANSTNQQGYPPICSSLTSTDAAATGRDNPKRTLQAKPASLPATTTKKATTPNSFRLYFVTRGHDMHEGVLVGPKRNARVRGAVVLDRFDRRADPSTFPTHFVIGSIQSREALARALGFPTLLELQRFMHDYGIWCVRRSWASQASTAPYARPRPGRPGQPGDLYAGILPLGPPKLKQKTAAHYSSRNSDAALLAKAAAAAVPQRNRDLAEVFSQLSKAYQKAPLDPIDSWRSYTFNIAAGRLQALPFDVTSSTLSQLSSIKGFGSSVLAILEEYVQQQPDDDEQDEEGMGNDNGNGSENDKRQPTITIRRLQEIQTNPQRRVLREFMRIWGVGRVKALELIKAGYTSIAEIRSDFKNNQLRVSLERNQYIGVLCYEDLLEKMTKAEVERIGAIVRDAVQERFAQAEVQIMGSYRRNKGSYGDVDILITHPAHVETVPPKALGRIIDHLRADKHIAYNLTQLAGMDTDAYETLPAETVRALQLSPVTPKRDKATSSSYMGVFVSPMIAGKMRRVDIKFYPYRERIFASLYFTGNGHFNRSMRLWATRKHGYKLSDHGLFQRGGGTVSVMSASNEAQIFRRLQLVYKEPHERDGFDAVIGHDSRRVSDLEAWTSEEFRQAEQGHSWID